MSKESKIFGGWSWADTGIIALILVFAVYNRLMPILLIITAFSLIWSRNDFDRTKQLLSPKYPFIWFVLFFFSHLIGLIYSENVDFGIADIGMKLSFFMIPLYLFFAKIKLNFSQIIKAYIMGLLVACVICYFYAGWRSIYNYEDNHWAYFTGSYISFMMHRSYFATYLAIGTLITVIQFFNNSSSKKQNLFYSILFGVTTVLTFSKAGILILLLFLIPLSFYLIAKFYNYWFGIAAVIIVVGGAFFTIKSSQTLNVRFTKMIEGALEHKASNNTSVESSASRMIMWTTSFDLIGENLIFGVGTGDVKDALNKRNLELGNTGVVEHNLNSHNQYLNTGVQLGLLGVIPLIMVFITCVAQSFRRKNIILFFFSSCLAITMLFESFLETQAGIIPVTLLLSILVLTTINEVKSPKFNVKFDENLD